MDSAVFNFQFLGVGALKVLYIKAQSILCYPRSIYDNLATSNPDENNANKDITQVGTQV